LDTSRLQSANFWCDAKITMTPITEQDVREARSSRLPNSQEGEDVRIVVLPHMPLDKMAFSVTSREEVLIARQMEEALKTVPGVAVKTSDIVEREFAKAITETQNASISLPKGQSLVISLLARRLIVDFVIFGY